MKKIAKGFTLIELMVVVAIIGIIGAFALPNYRDYMLRAHNADAMAALSSTKLKMEQYYQDNRTYTGACASGSRAEPPTLDNFSVSCVLDANSYTLTATGNGFSFSVDETNAKSTDTAPSGWPTNDSCWIVHKNGSCQ